MDSLYDDLLDQSLLAPLIDEDLAWLETVARLQHYEPGDFVYTAGDPPSNFYLVVRGQFEYLEPVDGRWRRLQYLYPQDFFGDIALLENIPHPYSVRATLPSDVIAIPADAFFELIEAYPEIQDYLERTAASRVAPPRTFPGQEEDEIVIYWERRHPFELLRRLLFPVALGAVWTVIALLVLFLLARQELEWGALVLTVWGIGLLPLAVWGLWEAIDWWNDYYIVTDRRVLHLEQVLLLYQERREAPISKVQNVNSIRRGPIAAALNFGDVTIETAAQTGAIQFRAVPDSEIVAARIIQERDKARAALKRASESYKRRELRRALGLEPAPSPESPPASGSTKAATTQRSRLPPGLTTEGIRYFIPRTREQQGDAIIWRKHWIILLRRSLRPWLLLLLTLASAIVLAFSLPPLSPPAVVLLVLVVAILGLVSVGWLLWEYEDWHNDVYILTPTAIVDEERRPLALRTEVKQASLDQIQDVTYEITNPLMMLLNVGTVIIQTAGSLGRLDFTHVRRPAEVQAEIFRYIQRMAEARQARESARISDEVLDLLRIYQEEISRSASAADQSPRSE